MADPVKLLLVDDEDGLRTLMKSELEAIGYAVDEADGGTIALEVTERISYDVIILDIRMPDIDGITVLKTLRSRQIPSKIVMLTGVDELRLTRECLRLGANDYLTKPIQLKNLINCIERVMKEPV
ncbi:MAG TPA: response regulator [Bacteroidota bacterium]|nr:response regulator [Bacteroidota bacterium]